MKLVQKYRLYFILGAVIVIGAAIILALKGNSAETNNFSDLIRSNNNQDIPSNDTPAEVEVSRSTPATATTPSTKPSQSLKSSELTYDQAIQIYGKSGYRIQLVKCHGTPGTLVIKKGSKFMLDNRDGVWHNVTVGKQKFRVSGWGFIIVTASEVGNVSITCDGGGAATLNVQP